MLYQTIYRSPLGAMLLVSDSDRLHELRFVEPDSEAVRSAGAERRDIPPILKLTRRWLEIYFRGEAPDFTPKMALAATLFRVAVWEILLTIPFGRTMTYGEVAAVLARRNRMEKVSAQAVGNAVGHNRIALVIPCHRVIGANGRLVGYSGGLERKAELLTHEGASFRR